MSTTTPLPADNPFTEGTRRLVIDVPAREYGEITEAAWRQGLSKMEWARRAFRLALKFQEQQEAMP